MQINGVWSREDEIRRPSLPRQFSLRFFGHLHDCWDDDQIQVWDESAGHVRDRMSHRGMRRSAPPGLRQDHLERLPTLIELTGLEVAITSEDMGYLDAFLADSRSGDVNESYSPLFLAVWLSAYGNCHDRQWPVRVARRLLEDPRVNPNRIIRRWGWYWQKHVSPIAYAAQLGAVDIIDVLLEHQDPACRYGEATDDGLLIYLTGQVRCLDGCLGDGTVTMRLEVSSEIDGTCEGAGATASGTPFFVHGKVQYVHFHGSRSHLNIWTTDTHTDSTSVNNALT